MTRPPTWRFLARITFRQDGLARAVRNGMAGIRNARGKRDMHVDSLGADCFCCGKKLQFAPDSDPGQIIERYGIIVCTPCFEASASGWTAKYEEKLLGQLQRSHIAPPVRNPYGLLPRD